MNVNIVCIITHEQTGLNWVWNFHKIVLFSLLSGISLFQIFRTFEPRYDKTNIMGLRPTWIQTSLRVRAVWSGSMLSAINFSTCYRVCKRTAWILIRLRACAGWSGSMLVANPLCWFCHGTAHLVCWKSKV
jgi:hypothetical protein